MGHLGLLLLALCGLAQAQNINCGPRTRRVVAVDNATSYTFTTQRLGYPEYQPNTECRVLYKQGPKCRTIQFSCSKVAVKGVQKKPSKETSPRFCFGDFMRVRRYGEKQRYCRGEKPKPEFNSTGAITVFFRSNPMIESKGAVCKIECTEDTSMWKGTLTSKDFPYPYPDNDTTDTVTVHPGYFIKFTYLAFDVDAPAELEILNTDNSDLVNAGSTSGNIDSGTLNTTFTVPHNEALVVFTASSNNNSATGYLIKWEAIKDPLSRSLDLDYDSDFDLEALEAFYSE